jgi:hypothetical protein
MTLSIKIKDMTRIANTGIVTAARWVARDSANGFTAEISGESILRPPVNNPIPYTELSEETVVAWVTNLLGAEVIADYQAVLTSRLEAMQYYSRIVTGLPWQENNYLQV